jgi:hypothetical protein
MADSAASKVQIPLPVAFATDNGIWFYESVGTTGRAIELFVASIRAWEARLHNSSKLADENHRTIPFT